MGRDEYREERVKKAVIKHGKTPWHYTDINALCGIIGKKEIWFGTLSGEICLVFWKLVYNFGFLRLSFRCSFAGLERENIPFNVCFSSTEI